MNGKKSNKVAMESKVLIIAAFMMILRNHAPNLSHIEELPLPFNS